jgi:hypothetical protein
MPIFYFLEPFSKFGLAFEGFVLFIKFWRLSLNFFTSWRRSRRHTTMKRLRSRGSRFWSFNMCHKIGGALLIFSSNYKRGFYNLSPSYEEIAI